MQNGPSERTCWCGPPEISKLHIDLRRARHGFTNSCVMSSSYISRPNSSGSSTAEPSVRSLSAHQPDHRAISKPSCEFSLPTFSLHLKIAQIKTKNIFEPQMFSQPENSNQLQRSSSYPWSIRSLAILPQSPVPQSSPQSTALSPTPFPRYGHSIAAIGNQSGELFLFGGLVKGTLTNELFCISSRDQSVCLMQVKGDIPSPRIGHASALINGILIVWGGDTQTDGQAYAGGDLDDGLYLLNLSMFPFNRIGLYWV